ncbi:MAG: hypothetical protein EON59_10035 [Alphaproteobacteria bacterium]|nr:MAG: hypothetical protein EON59_10035 [Alphaproteobacteria bacterium]
MQAEFETWALASGDTDSRSPELADRSVSGATRPPRKRGTKPLMEFNLACCITLKTSGAAGVRLG